MENESDAVSIKVATWPDDADALRDIRRQVFIDEQGVPEHIEWDGQDAEARHVIAQFKDHKVGCGRVLPSGRIGRLAVLAEYRNRRIGEQMLQALIGVAQARGDLTVYLHAQADAVAFYERAGFSAQGAPFDEAGIEHLTMQLKLDYRDWDQALSPLSETALLTQLVTAQARLAGRELRILSPLLDPRLFDQEDLLSALRSLARRGRMSRIQILVQDAKAIAQRGHGLLQLARRMPSAIEMRSLPEHPLWNDDSEVLRDRDSRLVLPGSSSAGFYQPGSRAMAESALNRFEDLWRAGEVDPEFRALSL